MHAASIPPTMAVLSKGMLETACDGPWLLLKLAPGKYHVFARLPGTQAKRKSALVQAPPAARCAW